MECKKRSLKEYGSQRGEIARNKNDFGSHFWCLAFFIVSEIGTISGLKCFTLSASASIQIEANQILDKSSASP
ncbi:hypothetical protein Golob_022105, partial [Gossypium lobatum]|nr:hypothetical protein [Gossypium lobatum]